MSRTNSIAVTVLSLLAACSRAPAPACASGQTNPCTCAGGGPGQQLCDPSGAFFAACVCPGPCEAPGAHCTLMPDVRGQDLDGAGAAITGAGLLLPDPVDPAGYITVQRRNDPPVQVLEQVPAAGAKALPGTRVVLTVTIPPNQASLGLPNSNFLVGNLGWQDTFDTARAYYDLLDPPPLANKTTLAGWKAAVGFGTPADAEASALYVTHTDLGFGRHMHMRRQGQRVASYVENYPTIDDAIAGTRLIATVAMEWGPGSWGGGSFTQFYTFNKKGVRIEDPALDDYGHKLQPAVCLSCHGGSATAASYVKCTSPPTAAKPCGGWLGARFIPFDLAAESFSDRPGYRREDQEAAFKMFNEAVELTWKDDARYLGVVDSDPVPALIDSWYGGDTHPLSTQLSNQVPPHWGDTAEARDLYLKVFSRSCQTCHAQRDALTNFSSYEKFRSARDDRPEGNLVHQRVFENGSMPLSQRGYLNFWLSYPSQPKALAAWLHETTLPAPGMPVARVSPSICDPTAGPACPAVNTRSGRTVWLDGRDSQFNDQWTWRQTLGLAVALLPNASAPVVSFDPPLGFADHLEFELVVSLGGLRSSPRRLSMDSQAPPSTPPNLAVRAGAFKAEATWDEPVSNGLSALTSYTVLVRPGGQRFTTGPDSRRVPLTGLAAGTSYTASVTATNAIGESPRSAEVRFSLPTPPGKPVVTAVQPGIGSATITWVAPPDGGSPILGYTVLASAGGSWLSVQAAPGESSAVFTGLTNGARYSFSLFASNAVGDGQFSDAATATPADIPEAPGRLLATRGNGFVRLQWSAPGYTGGVPLVGYLLSGAPGLKDTSLPADTTQFTVPGLANGTAYAFELVARNALFSGPPARAGPVTPATVPDAPAAASVAALDGTSATVSWTAPASDGGTPVRSYLVTSSPGGATLTVGAGATSATVTNLTTDSIYSFTVVAVNDIGPGGATSTGPVMPDPNPGVPSAPSITSVAAAAAAPRATLSWSAPIAAGTPPLTGYTISATEVVSGSVVTTVAGAGALSGIIAGLTGGLSYRFTVAATNQRGTGPASRPSAPTPVNGPPQPPAFVTAIHSDGQLLLGWTAPANLGGGTLLGYTLSWPQAPARSLVAAASATSAAVTALASGTNYRFSLVANGQFGDSAPSTLDAVFAVAPGPPASASAASIDSAVQLAWTPPLDSGGLPVLDYTISWSTPPAGSVVCPASGSPLCPGGTSTNVGGLSNYSPYVFTIRARTLAAPGAAGTDTKPVIPTPLPGRPSSPALGVVTPGVEQATVDWRPPVDPGSTAVTGYLITAQAPGSAPLFKTITDPAATSGTLTLASDGLTGGVSYQFTVTARNAGGLGSPSATSALTEIVGRPQPPTGVTVARVADGSFQLGWTAPANTGGKSVPLNDSAGYLISWAPTPPAQPQQARGTDTTAKVASANFAVGASYTLGVAASNVYGTSASTAAAAISFAKAPNAPTNVVATPQSGGALGVTWTLPSSTAETGGLSLGNSVVTLTGGPSQTSVTHPSVSGTSDTFTGLTSGGFYAVAVQATNLEGSAPFGTSGAAQSNTVMSYSPAGAPSAPQAVAVLSTASRQATLGWSLPAYAGTTAITSYRVVGTPPLPALPVSFDSLSAATSTPIGGLTGGLGYTFTVQAQDAAGLGPASTPTPSQAILGPPQPPTGLTVQQQNGSFLVGWTPPLNTGGLPLTGYDLTSTLPISPANVSTTSTTVTGAFTVNQPYTISVAARNANGPSAATAGPATVFATAPGAPVIGSVVPTAAAVAGNTVSGSLSVTWAAPAANGSSLTGYSITATPATTGNPGSATAGASAVSAAVTGLSNCVSYRVQVIAINGVGSTASAQVDSSSPPAGPPATMAAPSPTPLTSGVSLTWTAPANDGCAIGQYELDTLAKGSSVAASSLFGSTAGSASSPAVVTGLAACPWNMATPTSSVDCVPATWITYQFSVRAHNAGGWSTASPYTAAARPLVSYGGDRVDDLWRSSTAAFGSINPSFTCTTCHTAASGNRLVLAGPATTNLSYLLNSLPSPIAGNDCIDGPSHTPVPVAARPSFLLACPTGQATGPCTPGTCPPGGTAFSHATMFTSGTAPYDLLLQWMLDGSRR